MRRQAVFLFVVVICLLFIIATQVSAKEPEQGKQTTNRSSQMGAKLGTDFQFDDLAVRGRYNSGFEGVATVENEKDLTDILGFRMNYHDRIVKSREQN